MNHSRAMAEEANLPVAGTHHIPTCSLYVVDHNGSLCQEDVLSNMKKLPLLQEVPADVEVIFLGEAAQNHQVENGSIFSPLQYLVEVYRQANLADKDRQTILTHDDQLVSLQLCMAQHNKQKFDDFDVDVSEVLQLSHQLYNHKLNPASASPIITTTQSSFDAVQRIYREFCENCNTIDILDVFHKVKVWLADDSQEDIRKKCQYVVLQWPRNELEVEILKLLSTGDTYCHVTMETADGNVGVSSKEESVKALIPKTLKIAASPLASTSASASEILARKLFISYLTLLVNSREEISLARCLSLTTDDLNHDGFTALKNEAKAKNMPMFQTAVSYVTQIRLGGKSYAPNPNSPLAPHVKGLSDFVTAVQKLQTLVEEVADTRTAVMKIISSIRSSLCKCKVSTLRKSSIDTVAEQLKQEMDALMGVWKGSLMESPPRKIEGQGRIIFGLKTIRVLQAVLDREAGRTLTNKPIHALTDGFTSQKTPMRIPSLLSQFRSPEVVDTSSPEYQTLRSRLFSPKEKTPVGPEKWKSDLTWAGPAVDAGNHADDMEIFVSPIQRRPPHKGNSLWALSPEGNRSRSRLISPNSDLDTHTVDIPTNHLAVRSQSILDCSDTPKKGKTAARKLPKDSALDKENLQNEDEVPKLGGKSTKRKPKRTLESDSNSSSQASKKAKKGTKVAKKKVVPLGKGQKTLNQFFRV